MIAEVQQWTGGGRKAGQLIAEWDADSSTTIEYFSSLLQPECKFKFETYANGKAPPRAKGMESKRLYAAATSSGPYATT